MAHACRILRDQNKPFVAGAAISSVFGMTKAGVEYHLNQWQSYADLTRGAGGRPSVFTEDQIIDIVQ
jgi:hypothetical protein